MDNQVHLHPTDTTSRSQFLDSSQTINEDIVNAVVRNIVSRTPPKMHHSSRRSICALPRNHFGPIPNVPVGTSWQYRLQVSESGVHRPIVAGIHGRENEGAYSIVLSGVYEDDKDSGETFLYSGCGGKEKDKKTRLGRQVFDQQLTRHNRALALCCNTPVNDVEGGDAKEGWKDGKPVRVVRKYSLGKYSKYAPEEGYRYDGIYKVLKYYPVFNQRTGLRVWTYELRRDDETPAPWTDEGKKRIEELNLKLILPQNDDICSRVENNDDSYVCSQAESRIVIKRQRSAMPSKIPKKIKHRRFRMDTNTYNMCLDVPIETPVTSFDIDVKPDISELSFASGASIPYATNAAIYEPPMTGYTVHNNFLPNSIDVEEQDVKPDVQMLDAMIAKQRSNSGCEMIEHSTLQSQCPTIQSSWSLSSMLPYTLSACGGQNSETSLKVKISNVSSSAQTYESNEDCKIPPGLQQSNLLCPIKLEHTWSISEELHLLIDEDHQNKFTWDYLKTSDFRAEQEFLNNVKLMFSCPSCLNMVDKPITTPCQHNVCSSCLERNFERRIFSCPYCRTFLMPESIEELFINTHLMKILSFLFPEESDQH